MTVNVKRWGSSVGVVIPSRIARKLGLTPGTAVDLDEREDGAVVIRKAGRRPRRPIAQIVKEIKRGSYKPLPAWDEVPPAGREVW